MHVVEKSLNFNLEYSHSNVFLDQNFEENQNLGHHFPNSFLVHSHLSSFRMQHNKVIFRLKARSPY